MRNMAAASRLPNEEAIERGVIVGNRGRPASGAGTAARSAPRKLILRSVPLGDVSLRVDTADERRAVQALHREFFKA